MVRPDRALPVAWSFARDWLPLLGAERWALVLALRIAASADSRRGSDFPIRVSPENDNRYRRLRTAISDLAPWAGMDRRRLGNILKGEPAPSLAGWWDDEAPHDFMKLFTMLHLPHLSCPSNEKGWQRLASPPAGTGRKATQRNRNRSQTCCLRLFIPRWRYTYDSTTGHRSGIELELLADDVPPPPAAQPVADAWLLQVRALILHQLPGGIPPELVAELGETGEQLGRPGQMSAIGKALWRIFALGDETLWQIFTVGRPLVRIFANYTYDTNDSLSALAERDTISSSPSALPRSTTIQPSLPSNDSPSPQDDPGGTVLEAAETVGIAVLSPGAGTTLPASTPQPGGLPVTADGGAVGGDVWSWNEREAWVQRVARDLGRVKVGQGNVTGRLTQAIWGLFTIAGRPDRADSAAFETLSQGAPQIWQRACALDRRVALAGQPCAAPLETLWQALAGTSYPVEAHRLQGLNLTAVERPPDETGIAAWQRRTAWIAGVGSTLERLGRNDGNAIGRLGTALWELCRLPGTPDTDAYAALGRLARAHGPTTIWQRACGLSAQAAMQGLSLTRPVDMLQAALAPADRQERITPARPAPLTGGSSTPVEAQACTGAPNDPLPAKVLALYEANFGRPAPLMARKIREAVVEYPDPEGWEIAFSYACEPGVSKPWGYMLEVLSERRQHGSDGTQGDENRKQPMSAVAPAVDHHPPPVASLPHPTPEHARVWQMVLDELELQMTKDTFDTWLAETQAEGIDGDTLIVAVPSVRAQAWLKGRLGAVVARTVPSVAERLENVRFVLAGETGSVA